jgi:methylated-DNA-protein-cysteine methyltransferase-like protein
MHGKLFQQINLIIQKVPPGKIATYGQIAGLAGIKDARIVGWALHGNRSPLVPCHRIVKANGSIAENYAFGGWQIQKCRLKDEGISFISKLQVDLSKHLWNPKLV